VTEREKRGTLEQVVSSYSSDARALDSALTRTANLPDLKLAQEGDPAAFERLVRPHVASLRRFAQSFCGNSAEANDLAQEALLKAYRSLPGFRGQGRLSTWLYSIARSTFVDSRRGHLARMRSRETPLDPEDVPNETGPDELVAARAEIERLRGALRELEPRFRVPIVLCEIEGLSYDQVATIEQVPIGTIRSRISRGRAKLLEILNRCDTVADQPGSAGTGTSKSASNVPRRTTP
jgi:RNA polymerase sigma-70 factor, ECF subfamily